MLNIEVHSLIHQINDLFYKLGIWCNQSASDFRRMKWLIYVVFLLCFVVSSLSRGFLTNDQDEAIFLAAVSIATAVIIVKLGYISLKKTEILEFQKDICCHSSKNGEEFSKINRKLKMLEKCAICYTSSIFLGCCISICSYLPILSSKKQLPFNIAFPLDWEHDELVYWVAYIYTAIAVLLLSLSSVFGVTIWYIMMNCSMKYQILGNEFRSMGSTTVTTRKKKISETEEQKLFLTEFIGLIKSHKKIRETIYRFKSCFSNLFFLQITTSGICICGSIYAIAFSSRENLGQSLIYITAIFYNIFDIFMIMYFANDIKLSSDQLSYCLFESNWIGQSKSSKLCIIIMTEVLKQPHELVIGKLYPLDLETFTSILNFAYSTLNILKNFR